MLAFASILIVAMVAPLQAQERSVTYVLPEGPDVLQAKLSGPVPETYTVVCDSLVDDACRVRPGTYQLQTFDGTWSGTKSTVLVSADSTPPADGRPAPPADVRFRFYSTTAGALF